ncbi:MULTISPECIES: RNA polymerase sigma factor [Ruminococcus]|uniref:RNA polymerase sigma factor n=1 Tax=Ruminococcus TaxID=1263 RepID=UPI00349FC476
MEQKLQYQELQAAIDTLPPEQGLAIRLKYVEDMTLQEIAAQFGVQPKAIKSRIHDGTVKLRKNCLERMDDP